MLIVKTWLNDLLKLQEQKNLKFYQNFTTKFGRNGLEIFKTGASQDNFGGVIEFQLISLRFQESLMNLNQLMRNIGSLQELRMMQKRKQLKDLKLMLHR